MNCLSVPATEGQDVFFYLHQIRVSALAVKLLTDKGALHGLSIFTKRFIQSRTTPLPIRSKQKFGAVPGLGHDYNHRPKVPVTHTWDCQAVGHMQRAWLGASLQDPAQPSLPRGGKQLPAASIPTCDPTDLKWTIARPDDTTQPSHYSAAHCAKAAHVSPLIRFLFGNRRSLMSTCLRVRPM